MSGVDAKIITALQVFPQYDGLFPLTVFLGIDYKNAWYRVQLLRQRGIINAERVGRSLKLSLAI